MWTEGNGFYLNGIRTRRKESWQAIFTTRVIMEGFQRASHETHKRCHLDVKKGRIWKDLKKTGFNSYRSHAVVHPPVYFESADEEGILVTAETSLYCTMPTPSDKKG